MSRGAEGAGQGLVAIEERLRFDEAALAGYLRGALPGFEGELTVRKFGYGQSNPTFLLTTSAGQRYVLRKKPPGKLIKGAHAVDREYRVMSAVGRAAFAVPKMHLLCEDEGVIGTPFYVMEFVQGPILDNALSNAKPAERRSILLSIVRVLAKLHTYDPAELGLLKPGLEFGRVGGFYQRQMATMEKTSGAQVSNSEGKVPPMRSMKALLDLFRANMPEDVSRVIHGDFKPDNVILTADNKPGVAAVIDWELSTIGHPMSDLANLCLAYHLPRNNPLGYAVFDLSSDSGIPTEEEVHRAYCEAAGAAYPISSWNFYVAFACFRLAVIVQGVALRISKGQASTAIAASAQDMVKHMVGSADFMCDLGYDIMRKATTAATGSRL